MDRAATRDGRRGRGRRPSSRSLGALGRIAYRKNDWAVVRSAHEEAAAIAERLGDPVLLAAASLDLSYVALLDDDYQRGRELLGES